jgi:predicted kinase
MNDQKILLTRGLQASGKTTFARNWVAEDPDWRVRVNRDDLRLQIANKAHGLSRHQEETITLLQLAQARAAIGAKLSVIIDDTNLRASTVKTWLQLGAELGVPVDHVDIPIDLEEAIKRDWVRGQAGQRAVGEEVIRDFHARYFRKGQFPPFPTLDAGIPLGQAYVPNPDLPKAVWLDIDGTVADMKRCGRGPFEWHRVGEDDPIQHVVDVVHALHDAGYKIVVMSGRDKVSEEDTILWLKKHNIPFDDIFMRPAGSQEKDNKIKHDLFWEHVAPKYDIRFALDDRNQVVEFTRDVLKIPVFQVAPGNF